MIKFSKCWKCSCAVFRRMTRMGTDFIITGAPRKLKHLVLTAIKLDEIDNSLEHSWKSHSRFAQEVKVLGLKFILFSWRNFTLEYQLSVEIPGICTLQHRAFPVFSIVWLSFIWNLFAYIHVSAVAVQVFDLKKGGGTSYSCPWGLSGLFPALRLTWYFQ
jgi:hypothetical protein